MEEKAALKRLDNRYLEWNGKGGHKSLVWKQNHGLGKGQKHNEDRICTSISSAPMLRSTMMSPAPAPWPTAINGKRKRGDGTD